jgi:hypothetical protein
MAEMFCTHGRAITFCAICWPPKISSEIIVTEEMGRAAMDSVFLSGHLATNPKAWIIAINRAIEKGGLADEVASLRAERKTLAQQVQDKDAEINQLGGAMAAQDEREAKAGEACGVPYHLGGCDWPDTVADEVLGLRAEVERLKGAEERCETWKAQAGRDQIEVRVLKARLAGAHVTNPGQDDGDNFSAPTLIEFLREAARNAKDGKWGMWRAKEFDQAADRLRELYESYLAVCPHEAEVQEVREVLTAVEAVCDEVEHGAYEARGSRVYVTERIRAALSGAPKTQEALPQA